MAVTIVGEVGNNCDIPADFNAGSFGTDDAAWEGSGAVGIKASATTVEFYTNTSTELGPSAPYDFSVGGTEEGWHIILWSNTKTPVNITTGLTIIVGNGTDRGEWNVIGSGIYSGGWQSRVINTAADFNNISAGTWTLAGNPAQLTAVSQMGGGFTTITSIMGSFNNVQIDQFTVGLGLRVDAGTVGTPNAFNTVKVADEDGTLWGWWSLSNGAFLGKGKIYIGPTTGSATSVFTDSAFTVVFADELVAADFYEINTRGAGTDVTWNLASISAANAINSRWGLTVDSTTLTFVDTNGIWTGGSALILNSTSTLTGTTFIDCTSLTQNSGNLDGCTILDANTATANAFVIADDITTIDNCSFEFSAGHALELTSAHAADPSTHAFDSNLFSGYAGTPGSNLVAETGSNDAAIFNDSGKDLIINIIGTGDTPSVRNGVGATTVINNTVTLTIQVDDENGAAVEGVRCAIYDFTGQVQGSEITSGSTNASGTFTDSAYSYGGDLDILIRARLKGFIPFVTTGQIINTGFSLGVRFIIDTIVD